MYPMRPVSTTIFPRVPDFWAQYKYDGWNIVIYKGKVWTRRGSLITSWRIFDGLNLNFDMPLQAELLVKNGVATDVPKLKKSIRNGRIVVHDVMIAKSIEKRRALLKSLIHTEKPWMRAPFFSCKSTREFLALFARSVEKGHEGIVLKRRGSSYYIGASSSLELPIWLKFRK